MSVAVEKEKQLREERRREYEEWKKKLVVDNPYFSVSMAGNKHSQLDKIKVVVSLIHVTLCRV